MSDAILLVVVFWRLAAFDSLKFRLEELLVWCWRVKLSRRRIVGVAGLLVGVLAVTPVLLGVVWAPGLGGWCFVSGVFGENDDQPYSVLFHGVNFSYVGSTYDYPNVTDMPVTAHFRVAFGDGVVENLTLHYDGYIGVGWLVVAYQWNATSHGGPRAGVLTGNSLVLRDAWQFWVAPFA